jgi:hypothetical protein
MYKIIVSQVAQMFLLFRIAVVAALMAPAVALAVDHAALERDARNTYQKLIARVPVAKALSRDACDKEKRPPAPPRQPSCR